MLNKFALVIVDFQKIFFSQLEKNIASAILQNISLLKNKLKQYKTPVIFTKQVYNFNTLPATITERLKTIGKPNNFLSSNSDSTHIEHFILENDDYCIEKSTYDPFLCDEFIGALKSNNINTLVVCGLYLDVCIDSLLRSAYQKGYSTILIEDATCASFYEKEQVIKFIRYFYNTTIYKTQDFIKYLGQENNDA